MDMRNTWGVYPLEGTPRTESYERFQSAKAIASTEYISERCLLVYMCRCIVDPHVALLALSAWDIIPGHFKRVSEPTTSYYAAAYVSRFLRRRPQCGDINLSIANSFTTDQVLPKGKLAIAMQKFQWVCATISKDSLNMCGRLTGHPYELVGPAGGECPAGCSKGVWWNPP